MKYNERIKKKAILFLIALIVTVTNCVCQDSPILYYGKIEIGANETYLVTNDSIYIDTLILRDNSKLKFVQNSTLIVEKAYIGYNCEFDASGEHGTNGGISHYGQAAFDGSDGNAGRDLKLVIVFYSIGSLTINTSGGNGGHGAKGRVGNNGQNGAIGGNDGGGGQNGGKGGNGGDGGNLQLHYYCEGFIPLFNGQPTHKNVINLIYSGGQYGKGGKGGSGGYGGRPINLNENSPTGNRVVSSQGVAGKKGNSGFSGSGGTVGKDGVLILKRIPN